MINCPNRNTDAWRSLNSKVPDLSNHIWHKLVGEVDKDGHPIENKDKFDKLLKDNDNDYKKTYLDYLGLSESELLKTPITKEDVTGDIETPMKDALSEKERKEFFNLTSLDRLAEIKQEVINRLKFKKELSQKKKSTKIDPEKAEEFIKKITELEADKSMILFIDQVERSTNKIYTEWLDIKDKLDRIDKGTLNLDKRKVLSSSKLSAWADYLSAYDSIEDYRNALTEDGSLDKNPELKKRLDDIIGKKNTIQRLYDVLGLDIAAEMLAPHNDKIYKDFEIKVRKKYKDLSAIEKSKISEETYIRVQKEMSDIDLRKQTFLMLRRELQKATNDIGLARRWVGNVLDSPNPVVAAIGQIMSFKEMEVHGKRIEVRDKIIPILQELEKFTKGKHKLIDIYEPILEKDKNGKSINKVISRFGSQFQTAYRDHIAKVKENEASKTSKEIGNEIASWINKNTKFRETEYNEAKWKYIDSLKDSGEISDQDYAELEWNELSHYPKKPQELVDTNTISETCGNLVGEWHSKNVWSYRDPENYWVEKNPQWYKFMKLTKDNPNSPIVKFYNLYKELEDESNSYIPASMRLKDGDMPGVFKTADERIGAGESLSSIAAREFSKIFNFIVDEDITRGNEPLIDERGNKRYFIPTHYTGKLDMKDQSFDLASNIFKFYSMAVDYNAKNSIYPDMEMIRHFIETRKPEITDKKGKELKFYNRQAEQLNDWFEMVFYGVSQKDEGSMKFLGLTIDKAKALDFISKSTAYNILSLNFRAGVANIGVSEVLQAGEAFAKQFMSIKSYHKAHTYYFKNLAGLLGDIGRRKPENIINLLKENFKVDADQLDSRFRDDTRLKKLAKTSNLFFFQTAGDSYENSKVFLGMLEDKLAYDKNGNKIGSMLDQYSKDENGKLSINKDVDLIKSQWTKEDQLKFGNKVQYVIEGIQGNYTDLGKTAMQRIALGRMAIMFRKFIVPGIEKRYKKNEYTQRIGDYTEGYYRTTARFLSNLAKEFKTYQFSVMGEEWNKLSHMEKSNIIRTISELGFMLTALTLAGIMTRKDRDDSDDSWFYDFSAYQLLRLKTEILFYTNPAEAMQILRSPMATMSLFETTMKAFHQILNPTEVYSTGKMKGHLKFEKILWDALPGFRAFHQTKDIKTQVNFMKLGSSNN